jgi:glycerate dehydrogenase
VLESEPISKDNPLLSFDNVVLTPHMGFKSMESEKRISEIVKNNTVDFIHGHPRNIVNLQ